MRTTLRIRKFGALGLVALVSAALIWLAVANAPAKAQVEEIVAQARAAGDPVTIADLAANPPAPRRTRKPTCNWPNWGARRSTVKCTRFGNRRRPDNSSGGSKSPSRLTIARR